MKIKPFKASAVITLIMAALLFIMLVAAVFMMPWLVKFFYRGIESYEYYRQMLVLLYCTLIPAFAADAALFMLLININLGKVFCSSNIVLIAVISWSCYVECPLFILMGAHFRFAYLVAFACAFMGTVVRVVKNAFEEAVVLKDENDYTI
ncbi:MAG: DUF2975 domain-containing protein [Firmicutes bacterium]|nr:DUF2975 domain-containing protein [Bacillota bacterium]